MWQIVALIVVSVLSVASYIIASQQNGDQTSISAGEIDAPTAEEGRVIPVLFGTCRIKSANIVWYGHLRIVPVKKSGGKK